MWHVHTYGGRGTHVYRSQARVEVNHTQQCRPILVRQRVERLFPSNSDRKLTLTWVEPLLGHHQIALNGNDTSASQKDRTCSTMRGKPQNFLARPQQTFVYVGYNQTNRDVPKPTHFDAVDTLSTKRLSELGQRGPRSYIHVRKRIKEYRLATPPGSPRSPTNTLQRYASPPH